jgi:5-methylcytosine-specific restriction enzyme A
MGVQNPWHLTNVDPVRLSLHESAKLGSIMPQQALHFCAAPGCQTLTSDWRCRQHRRQRHEEYDARRLRAGGRGYDRDWQRVRAQKLSMHPLCQLGKRCSWPTPASEVDHIVPVAEASELRLVLSNLQSVCHACHTWKTKEDARR